MLTALVGDTLLKTVCPEGQMPSAQAVCLDDLPTTKNQVSPEASGRKINFVDGSGVAELLGEPCVELDHMDVSTSRLDVAFYIRTCFRTWLDQEDKEGFQGEQEYILYGQESDRKNLLCAVKGIALLRMPFNYAYLIKDVEKQALLKTASVLLAALTGCSPMFLQYLLTAAAAYAEGLLDVRALLHGEKVALKKTAGTWRLSLTELFRAKLSGGRVPDSRAGLDYQDYLTLLALLKGKEEALYYRILDVITLNMRQEQPGFSMDHMLVGASFQYHITENPKFSAIPRQLTPQAYEFFYERSLSY